MNIKIGIRQLVKPNGVWRLAFDGTVFGDGREYTKAEAATAARALVEASADNFEPETENDR